MTNKDSNKGLGHLAARAMASIARSIAKDSVDNRCWLLVHQPSEPKNLAYRVQELLKK